MLHKYQSNSAEKARVATATNQSQLRIKLIRMMLLALCAGLLIAIALPAFSMTTKEAQELELTAPQCPQCSKGTMQEPYNVEQAVHPSSIYGY